MIFPQAFSIAVCKYLILIKSLVSLNWIHISQHIKQLQNLFFFTFPSILLIFTGTHLLY